MFKSGIYSRYARLVHIQKLISVIYHIDRPKDRMITSIDKEKAFENT